MNGSSIQEIQRALRVRFGDPVDTESGEATLSISHDKVTLTDERNQVVAENIESVAAIIGNHSKQPEIVTLDDLASELVGWYAKNNDRRTEDIVNGLVAGNIGHLRKELDEQYTDASGEHIHFYVMEAITRRKETKSA